MPPLTAELAGLIAVVTALLVVAVVVDPQARRTRKTNRTRRHAAQGCGICRDALPASPRPAGGKQARR